MPLSRNRSGQAYALTVLTPIVPAEADNLRTYLESLSQASSPLARLPRTHFGRWVIVPDFVSDSAQPDEDHLSGPHLLFTSNFDGPLDSYVDELCRELAPEASLIWGRCIGCPAGAAAEQLKTYLLGHRIDTGFFFAAYPNATAPHVKESLVTREKLIRFIIDTQELEAAALQRAFAAEFAR